MTFYQPDDPWEDAILFPVERKRVFVETQQGPRPTPRYRAIVHGDTGATIAVVSNRYRVLRNREALDWGLLVCTTAYPQTEADGWRVTGVEAASTGGHCHIALGHRQSDRVASEWRLGPRRRESFVPFLRVQNGYNGRTAFAITVGVTRQRCGNEMLVGGKSGFWLKAFHQEGMEEEIARAFRRAKVRKTMDRFQTRLDRLNDVEVPHDHFAPIIRRALKVQPPEQGGDVSWAFEKAIALRSNRYAQELGTTAYAVWAVITDLATRPPPDCFGRRGRSSLQRVANEWLHRFDNAIQAPSFDIITYCDQLLAAESPGG